MEQLIDGQIVWTGVGQLIQQAVGEVLDLEYPITSPRSWFCCALRQVGMGTAKEQKGATAVG